MFTKLSRRLRRQTAASVKTEQQKLDTLRYYNAHNQLMQLHLDRMQTALNVKAAA